MYNQKAKTNLIGDHGLHKSAQNWSLMQNVTEAVIHFSAVSSNSLFQSEKPLCEKLYLRYIKVE